MKKQLFLSIMLVMITQLTFAQESKQNVASNWLNENITEVKTNQSFDMNFSRPGKSGETFRYYHTVNGVEVYDSSIAIHVSNKDKVTYTSSTYDNSVETIDTNPNITNNEALNIAITALNIEGVIAQKEIKLYVYNKLEETKLVYRVTTMSEFLNGYWETIVDAKTGEVLSTKDIAIYEKEHKVEILKKTKLKKENAGSSNNIEKPSMMVDGTAMVFDPDPLTYSTNTYDGAYSDNNDENNAELEAARTAVILYDIDFDGTLYTLKGPFTEIASLQAPSTGLFQQASPDFDFTRNELGFEAANCYHHLDKSMRYINDELGIPLVSLYNNGVLRFDPHGFSGADNSSYGGGNLNFGQGGVDDAEDMDVILHELGHGLHDWITNGNLSQVNGLSEGSGDYWANSYKRSLGFWEESDASYYYVFGWDGHNPFWPGRRTNYTATYPDGLTGQIHTDGQIWSSALLEIWEIIGRDKTDAAFLEGLAMTNSGTNQQNAAIAVRQAAIDMNYTCDEIDAFTLRFEARGYNLPVYECDTSACAITEISTSNLSECNNNDTPGNTTDDFFTADVTVNFANVPETGTLDLSGDGTGSISVSELTSSYTFIGIEMPADGESINLSASFSDNTGCNTNETNAGTAPENCSVLSINDDTIFEISIYPNPADNIIMLNNITQAYNIAVYNLLGQKVISQKVDINTNTINVANLAKGTYVLKFDTYNEVLMFIKK